ncbi:MAG: hypothetical protein ACOYXN_02075 [Acidobacteriota bacterium]
MGGFRFCGAVLAVVLCVAHFGQEAGAGPGVPPPERFDGIFANHGGALPSLQAKFCSFRVEEWSSEEEILNLAKALARGGLSGARDFLWSLKPKATFYLGNSPSVYFQVVFSAPLQDGSRGIWAITGDQLGFLSTGDARAKRYPFGAIQIRLNQDGKGEGDMIGAAALEINPAGSLEIKSYGTPPFRLLDLVAKPYKPKRAAAR